jgi:hypothetical protein
VSSNDPRLINGNVAMIATRRSQRLLERASVVRRTRGNVGIGQGAQPCTNRSDVVVHHWLPARHLRG